MLHGITGIRHSLSTKIQRPNKKKTFFNLDLAKSSQYLAGTGTGKSDRIDRNRISGRTLLHIYICEFTVSCILLNFLFVSYVPFPSMNV